MERQRAERVPTGVPGLDQMLRGGFLRSSVNLVKGAPGTGKSCLGLTFIATGAASGEPGIIVTFEHFPKKMMRDAESIGIDLHAFEEQGLVRIIFSSPEVMLDQVQTPGGLLDTLVAESGARRIFVDSITQMERITQDPVKLRETIYAFLNSLLRHDLTAVISQEDTEVLGAMQASEYGVSYLVDAVIQLRYVELDSSIQRALVVIKQRATAHDLGIRRFSISAEGIKVENSFAELEGVLSGAPRKRELDAFMQVFGGRKVEGTKGE
jgi:circadian clock protein KaiC